MGDRIVLRALKREDLASYKRWLDNTEVTAFLEMGARPVRESDLEELWALADANEGSVIFGIVELSSGRLIGTCGLYLISWVCRRAQFNILIGEPEVWDKGYGGEATRLCIRYAFENLNLNTVQLGVNAENGRAIHSYENSGFVHEGIRRQFIFSQGRYSDMVVMSVLRSEYEDNK
jgi:RimJ/RimL family protein N-acetyltransferase